MNEVLGVFDRAYVINRDVDVGRMELASKRLAKVGIPFERFSAKCFTDPGKHRWAGLRGTNASHLAVVQTAKEQKLGSVLIMEDDVIFREKFCEMWLQILPKLKNLNYDIFFGYNWRNKRGDPARIKILPLEKTLCTHFWAVRARFYDTFIETALMNESASRPSCIDNIFTSKIARICAPTYNLVGQDEGISLVAEGEAKKLRWSA